MLRVGENILFLPSTLKKILQNLNDSITARTLILLWNVIYVSLSDAPIYTEYVAPNGGMTNE
jgi:hypothetical protein